MVFRAANAAVSSISYTKMLQSSITLAKVQAAAYVCAMPKKSTRLNANDWLSAGMRALSKDGPDALKAEPLAVKLSVSKGSFYWHFRDVPAFQNALLAEWETQAVAHIADQAATGPTPVARLRNLAQAFAAPEPTEPAIRSWAQSHRPARRAVDRVDAARLMQTQELLGESGIANPEMARILYSTAVGMSVLRDASPSDQQSAIGSLVDLVLALR